jgi:hypothetical protein
MSLDPRADSEKVEPNNPAFPAKAGNQGNGRSTAALDPRFRGSGD